jgi:hypothetical protein
MNELLYIFLILLDVYLLYMRLSHPHSQVCNSTFVTASYINFYFRPDLYQTTNDPDFRDIFPYTLNALSLFCELIENIISDSLTLFYSNQYISTTVFNHKQSLHFNSSSFHE